MRILVLAPQPFYTERGTPIAVRVAVDSLCRAGHIVDLLTFHSGDDIAIAGMTLHRIVQPPGIGDVSIGPTFGKLVCDLWLAVAAFKLIWRGRYDVVHAVEESIFIGIAGRALRRYRLVYDMDSLMADQIVEKWPHAAVLLPILRWFERYGLRQADLILPVCQAICDRVSLYTRKEKIHLLSDIAFTGDPSVIGKVEDLRSLTSNSAPIALYAGNLQSYQGIDLQLEALAALSPERRCNLFIIGGSPAEIDLYKRKSTRLQLNSCVYFLGQRPLADLTAYLLQADILCSPRLRGVNTPMKIYSYMSSGRAILATDIESHNQVLDNNCAVLVAPTADAMAEGLDRLASDATLRNRLGLNAAMLAERNHSQKVFDERLRRAYSALEVNHSLPTVSVGS